nr:structural maintenance of chromosomes protein 1A-like [Onthophagus taurus]
MTGPRLKHVIVENFKTFRGNMTIGPLEPFNVVVGPNGSGKSNFMDAISFVMGEKTGSLRVKRLSDLIHGAAVGKPVSRSCSVTAVFILNEEGEEIAFQRSVQGSASEYRLNGSLVSNNEYKVELEKLRINVKAKNFLVFQGAVELIAMQNPEEMTLIFEEVSGSGALREDYDKLKSQLQEAQEKINLTLQNKKKIYAERKEASFEEKEAGKYTQLKAELNDKLVEHQLFHLFHNEQEVKKLKNDLKEKQREVEKIEQRKENSEAVLRDKCKNRGRINRELAELEQDIRKVEVEIFENEPEFIKAKERLSNRQQKHDGAIKTLEQARKAHEAHMNDIKKLNNELAQVEKAKEEYETTIAGESQRQGCDVHLEDDQVVEYHRLKDEAAIQSAGHMHELDSVNREQKADQDRLDNVTRLRTETENKHRQKDHEQKEMQKKIEKLTEYIQTIEQALLDQKKLREGLQSEVGSSKDRVQEIERQLEDVVEQLGDLSVEQHEYSRRKNQQQIVEKLKSSYPGVYDRMINMCQPAHKRYNVAVTKVFGKYMEAIVVDTEHTAHQCIKYLKEQMLEPETFLPLSYLQHVKIKERLRHITEPKGVKLLHDVVLFEPQAISEAVLFVTNNVVVCETMEDANKVAYESQGGFNNAIALDGTFYQSSGMISSGSLDLDRRAKRWDEKHMSQLKARQDKLTEELRDSKKKSRKESELNTVDSQIRVLEMRLKYAKMDMESTNKQIKKLEKELEILSNEITQYILQMEEIEKPMQVRQQEIKEVELKMNNLEDAVFSAFCQEIGVKNIRQYEDSGLRARAERQQKHLEFQKQINRITTNLEFEKSRNTQNNVSRCERTVNEEEKKIESCKKEEATQREKIDKYMRRIDRLKAQRLSKKQECAGMEEEVRKARIEVAAITKDVQAVQKEVLSLKANIETKQSDRHAILMQCKIDDIVIPVLVGNLEDIVEPVPSSNPSGAGTSTSAVQYEREASIQMDYSQLSDHLKDLDEIDDIKKEADKLYKAIQSLQDSLSKIQAPNLRATQKWEAARAKLQSNNEEFESLRKQNRQVIRAFEKIKLQRYQKFTRCFDHVSNEIDNIYKSLVQDQSAQALLIMENPEEPYLEGINYNCIAPGKRFQPMLNLSGGEKALAALALLFAIHSYQPAPFFVLDEVDAPLDNANVLKLAKYIKEKRGTLQTIAISLKDQFCSYADYLIGITPVRAGCLVSNVFTCDLTKYPY